VVAGTAIPERTKRLVLVACIAGSSVAFLDTFLVNVALPAIRSDLGGGLAAQQWVANAYLLTLGSLMLVGGSMGDVFGERRMFSAGLAAFGVTSLLCAVAPSVEVLLIGRGLQGAAGALLIPATLALIVGHFTEGERGAAIGSWTAWTGVATVVGPLVGGQLVDLGSWRYVFAVNVPLVVVTLALVAGAVPPDAPRPQRRALDLTGATLAALGLAGPVFALIEQPQRGWGDPFVAVPLVAGITLLVAFVLWERRRDDPMLPLGLFRRRNFTVGNIETLAVYAGLAVLFFVLMLFLQQVAGYSPLEAGAASTPTTAVLFLLSKQFGALADRFGPRLFMAAGPLVSAVGMALLLRIDADFDYLRELLPSLLVFAVGLAMTVAPLTAAVLAGVEEGNAGIASGVNNALARVAELAGIAVVGLLVAARFGSALDDGVGGQALGAEATEVLAEVRDTPLQRPPLDEVPPSDREVVAAAAEDASVAAFHAGMAAGAAFFAVGGVVAAVSLRNARRTVRAQDCSGGAIVGHPSDFAACEPPVFRPLERAGVVDT
jgi:EmrB/QacA subfamily drug resistance transporter